MINSYRSRETVEALLWNGENQEELKEFVGEDNVDFIFYTNRYPTPTILINGERYEVDLGMYIVMNDEENITIYNGTDFLLKYELI